MLLVLSCNGSPTEPDKSVVVPFGASSQVNSDLRIAFVQVIEDSRCPASVACAWAGNGAILLDITTRGGTQSVRLNTAGGATFPREASIAGYTVTLAELNPQRQTPDPIPMQQYRATLRMARSQ